MNGASKVPALVLTICVFACSSFMCENEVKQKVTSPDSFWDAFLAVENCGATTDYVTEIVVASRGKSLRSAMGGGTVFVATGLPQIIVRWEGPNRLVVRGQVAEENVVTRTTRWHHIEIVYENGGGGAT